MKQLIVVTSMITLTTSHSFGMETVTSNIKKTDKRFVVFNNLLPTNDPDIPNPRIDIVTKGDNVVEFYRDKGYIHNPHAKGVTSLRPGEARTIFLKTKKAPDQLGIDEDGLTGILNIYMYANSQLIRLRVIKPEAWHVAPAFEGCMCFKLINNADDIPNPPHKKIGLFTKRLIIALPLIEEK